ncbi:MAG: hypothetical protein IPK27_18030 [Rhodanobacteraceae bacterium]|nr:hypothetical protein [Rhodanobacteraceae bacterium]
MRLLNFLLGTCAALLAAAALGALWSLLALAAGNHAAWMAPLAALLLAALLRYNSHPPGALRALVCALLVLLTSAHANYLIAAGFIAGQMGLELPDAIRVIGIDMAWAVTRAHAGAADMASYAIAVALALVLGWRIPGEGASSRPRRR